MYKLNVEKAEKPEIIWWDHRKSKRIKKKKIYFCFVDYAKTFDCVDDNKL